MVAYCCCCCRTGQVKTPPKHSCLDKVCAIGLFLVIGIVALAGIIISQQVSILS
jgi:hypothetical protein